MKNAICVTCPGGKGPRKAGGEEGEEDDEEEGVGRALLQVRSHNLFEKQKYNNFLHIYNKGNQKRVRRTQP